MNDDQQLIVELILQSDENDVEEGYKRRGPAGRIRSEVKPIKIMVTGKGGTKSYRTYYVADKKHAKYSAHEKMQRGMGIRQTKYVTYLDQAKGMFSKSNTQGASFQRDIGKWTDNFTHLSGIHNSFADKVGMRKTVNPETMRVHLKDQNGISKTEVIKTRNGDHLSTESRITDMGNGKHGFKYVSRFNQAGSERWSGRSISGTYERGKMSITDIKKGYNTRDLGHMVVNHADKFNQIEVPLTGPQRVTSRVQSYTPEGRAIPGQFEQRVDNLEGTRHKMGELLSIGFKLEGDNAGNSAWSSIKQEHAGSIRDKFGAKAADAFTKSSSLQEYQHGLLRTGKTHGGVTPELVDSYSSKLGSTKMTYTNSATDEKGKRIRTESSKMLHAHMLQTDVDNDYHKGMVLKERGGKHTTTNKFGWHGQTPQTQTPSQGGSGGGTPTPARAAAPQPSGGAFDIVSYLNHGVTNHMRAAARPTGH